MTSNASHAAGARAATTEHTVTVKLTPDDLTMIRAFIAWNEAHPTCSPKKYQIARGFGVHSFRAYLPGTGLKADTTGPNVFTRLVALHVIEHSRNGHCWLTSEGRRIAALLAAPARPTRAANDSAPRRRQAA